MATGSSVEAKGSDSAGAVELKWSSAIMNSASVIAASARDPLLGSAMAVVLGAAPEVATVVDDASRSTGETSTTAATVDAVLVSAASRLAAETVESSRGMGASSSPAVDTASETLLCDCAAMVFESSTTAVPVELSPSVEIDKIGAVANEASKADASISITLTGKVADTP